MKHVLLAALCGISFSHAIFANGLEELRIIAQAYTELGEDNNYVDTELMTSIEFLPLKPKSMRIGIEDKKAVAQALEECVFMKAGAYGDHFTDELMAIMIDRFNRFITLRNAEAPMALFRVDAQHTTINTGIFNAPCVLAIQQGNSVLMMQAAAMD